MGRLVEWAGRHRAVIAICSPGDGRWTPSFACRHGELRGLWLPSVLCRDRPGAGELKERDHTTGVTWIGLRLLGVRVVAASPDLGWAGAAPRTVPCRRMNRPRFIGGLIA